MNDEYYFGVLNRFFNSIDTRSMSKEELGKAYLQYFYNNKIKTPNLPDLPTGVFDNVGVVADEADLSYITKRVPLVSDMTFLTHNYRGGKQILYSYDREDAHGYAHFATYYVTCPVEELGAWLIDCKPMLLQGKLFYFPNIREQHRGETYWEVRTHPPRPWNRDEDIPDIFLQGKQLSYIGSKDVIETIKPIMSLKLPVIEGTSLQDFSRISIDSSDSFECFRDLLKLRLIELDSDRENIEKKNIKLELEIKDGLRKVESELSLMKKKRAFGLAGASVITCSAFLYALPSINDVSNLIANILGTSGGVMVAGKTLQEYITERGRIESNPYYYLWLLKK